MFSEVFELLFRATPDAHAHFRKQMDPRGEFQPNNAGSNFNALHTELDECSLLVYDSESRTYLSFGKTDDCRERSLNTQMSQVNANKQ